MTALRAMIGRWLCKYGFHDFRVLESTFDFGPAGGSEKVECKRCGVRMLIQS